MEITELSPRKKIHFFVTHPALNFHRKWHPYLSFRAEVVLEPVKLLVKESLKACLGLIPQPYVVF